MNRTRTLFTASFLTASTLAYVGLVSRQPVSAQTAVGAQNTHVDTLRTIPKDFGRVVGTVTSITATRDEHSLVMEAADGTIRVVPFNRERAVAIFPRD